MEATSCDEESNPLVLNAVFGRAWASDKYLRIAYSVHTMWNKMMQNFIVWEHSRCDRVILTRPRGAYWRDGQVDQVTRHGIGNV